MRLSAQLAQKRIFDLFPCYISYVQDPALGMTALFAKVKLAMSGNLTFIELQTEFYQFANPLRTFGDDRAHDRLVTQAGARFKRIAHVQLKRIFITRHTRNPALRPGSICVRTFAFRYNRDGPVLCRFQCKTQAGDTAADHDEIVLLHAAKQAILPAGAKCSNTRTRLSASRCTLSPQPDIVDQASFPENHSKQEQ